MRLINNSVPCRFVMKLIDNVSIHPVSKNRTVLYLSNFKKDRNCITQLRFILLKT